ncbi:MULTISPECIES: thiamine pyrophosphate-binding protein [Pseudofrankia]|uniref:thiamine pyrophosphate-binding protein n=1 Tax=Pseudofrankia TaxID=2994363 RepID=UPI000234D5F0|nr:MULTISPECIES: thiamine pyrophosphate-binding protein [Pseudofrankia]OHV31713.1 acetolactate synthase [Pseudofrankia sp. EUN1h]
MGTTTGGELVARTLVDLGVTHAFGVHGGHLDPLLTALDALGVTLVDTRHEAAAGNAAEGYARATGGLGVAFATSGPGFTNAYAALANAYIDRIPILLLTSSPPLREAELNVLQGGLDQVAAARTVAKWAHRATTAARLPDLVALAVRHATTGVPGPAVLDIPIDVMYRKIDEAVATRPSLTMPTPPAPASAALRRMVELLRTARRPVLVLGGGAALSRDVRPALEALLDQVRIPVVTTSWGHGQISPDHPCALGGSGALAALPFLAERPDLFVLLGARQGITLGARSGSMIAPGTPVVHVDVDGVEPGRLGEVELSVVADVGETLRTLALAAAAGDLPDWEDWNTATRAAVGAHALMYADAPAVTPSGRLHPYHVARELTEALEDDAVVVYDGGETAGWINFFARAHRPRSWFGLGMMGGLGVGQGFAIGAQCARPGAQVVLVTGDGAVGFHLQEFDTMARHRLPVTTVVYNNLSWGMSLHGQQAIYGEKTSVAVELPDTRYDLIAAAMGLYAERVDDLAQVRPALRRARESGRPACLDVAIAADVVHPMMAPLTADLPDGSIRVPYYEAIPSGEG